MKIFCKLILAILVVIIITMSFVSIFIYCFCSKEGKYTSKIQTNTENDKLISEQTSSSNDVLIEGNLEFVIESDILKSPIIQTTEQEDDEYTFEELEKLFNSYKTYNISYKSLDFSEFKPSYNLLVSNALTKVGYDKDYFINWYNQIHSQCLYDEDWPIMFLSWCISATNKDKTIAIIPEAISYEEIKTFFEVQNKFYKGGYSCKPYVGFLILYDEDNDGFIDMVSIISEVTENSMKVIYGDKNSSKVETRIETKSNPSIVGYCAPEYLYNRVENNSGFELNALDTVSPIINEEYVKIIAENNIEVIARYINPEGRTPLSLEEVKLFSKYGIRTMMIYQINKDDPYKGYDIGVQFAEKALEYAKNLQAPKGTPIYFCCDCTNYIFNFNKVAEFFMGVRDVFNGEYSVGLYGGFYVGEAMYNIGIIDSYWQTWGYSDRYISDNYDMLQWSGSYNWFEDIPTLFDANHVKNPEKVSFILTS